MHHHPGVNTDLDLREDAAQCRVPCRDDRLADADAKPGAQGGELGEIAVAAIAERRVPAR